MSLYSEDKSRAGTKAERRHKGKIGRSTSILHTPDQPESTPAAGTVLPSAKQPESTVYWPYCTNTQHFFDQCANFAQQTVEQRTTWIKLNKRCWRCGHTDQAAQCRLKIMCQKCKGKHLQALHDVNIKLAVENLSCLINTTNEVLYLDRQFGCGQALLKVSNVMLRNSKHTLQTYDPR